MFTDETWYSVYDIWLHEILVYDSMSTIGIWVLRATPPWREPPPETLISWHWSKWGTACYTSMVGATSRISIPLRHGSCVLRLSAEPPPESLSLYVSPLGAHHSSHMPLGVSMVFMRWWPLGPATSMPIIWLFFPGYTWIKIVHDSEGSLIMDHGLCLWNFITWFHRHWIFIAIVFIFMEFKHIVSWDITHFR